MKPTAAILLATTLLLGSVSVAEAQRDRNRAPDDFPGDVNAPWPERPLVVFPPYSARNPHTDWCFSYRPGYNPYDNTFQGYCGERVYCRSPYGG
ncbi:MAG: BA14K family protein [Alphaproteobacteria bacterium]|nr:BA14K family protein [Alphaproteobacteria bacterium]